MTEIVNKETGAFVTVKHTCMCSRLN